MVSCKSLEEVRENIDLLDKQIVKLIAKRSVFVKQAIFFKKFSEIEAPKRAEDVVQKVRKLAAKYNVDPNLVEAIYRKIIEFFIKSEFDEYERKTASKVHFL